MPLVRTDRLNEAWWLVSLLRLRINPFIRLPLIARCSFSEMSGRWREKDLAFPIEFTPDMIRVVSAHKVKADKSDLDWIRQHWVSGGAHVRSHTNVDAAFQAFDQCSRARTPALAMVQLWAGLELLFVDGKSDKSISDQLAHNLSSFIEKNVDKRRILEKQIRKLYGKRSGAAHAATLSSIAYLQQSYSLMQSVLIDIVGNCSLPDNCSHVENVSGSDTPGQ
jgi:hypothetical protein